MKECVRVSRKGCREIFAGQFSQFSKSTWLAKRSERKDFHRSFRRRNFIRPNFEHLPSTDGRDEWDEKQGCKRPGYRLGTNESVCPRDQKSPVPEVRTDSIPRLRARGNEQISSRWNARRTLPTLRLPVFRFVRSFFMSFFLFFFSFRNSVFRWQSRLAIWRSPSRDMIFLPFRTSKLPPLSPMRSRRRRGVAFHLVWSHRKCGRRPREFNRGQGPRCTGHRGDKARERGRERVPGRGQGLLARVSKSSLHDRTYWRTF